MNDSLKVIEAIKQQTFYNNTIDIINNINSFYNSAWEKLIILGYIIGIGIPILFAFYQRRLYNLSKKELSEEIKLEISDVKKDLEQLIIIEVDKRFNSIDKRFNEMESKFDKKLTAIDAGTFHIQANSHVNKNDYTQALIDFVAASRGYLEGEDYLNFSIVTKAIYQICLPKLTYIQIEDLINRGSLNLESFLKEVENGNQKGLFSHDLNNLRVAINNTKKIEKA